MVGPPGLAKHRGFPSCLSLVEAGAAGHGSPGCVTVNPQELLFPSVSQCPLSVPQCLPCVPQCLPSISQCLPSVPKCLLCVPQCPPSVPKCLSSVPKCPPSVPKCLPSVSQCPPSVSQCPPSVKALGSSRGCRKGSMPEDFRQGFLYPSQCGHTSFREGASGMDLG